MIDHNKIILELLRLTELMNSGLKNSDIDIVIEMLEKRKPLIEQLNEVDKSVINGSSNDRVQRLLALDKENNVLLENVSEEMKKIITEMELRKATAKKSNKIAKRYLSDGQGALNYSKFNKKT